jgi:hypothetical protein
MVVLGVIKSLKLYLLKYRELLNLSVAQNFSYGIHNVNILVIHNAVADLEGGPGPPPFSPEIYHLILIKLKI